MDLSSPHGSSINDHISKEEFTLHYTSFDTALKMVARHGRGSLMAKVDIKHAFRLCPVRRKDWELLRLYWQNNYFVDLRLPFGLRSSPPLFNLWQMHSNGFCFTIMVCLTSSTIAMTILQLALHPLPAVPST